VVKRTVKRTVSLISMLKAKISPDDVKTPR
jgi:hypothetical protein